MQRVPHLKLNMSVWFSGFLWYFRTAAVGITICCQASAVLTYFSNAPKRMHTVAKSATVSARHTTCTVPEQVVY
jgi:hypothetical protein